MAILARLESLISVAPDSTKTNSAPTLELTVAGWFTLFAATWELLFNRMFAYLGFYSGVGANGPLAWLATSGYLAMTVAGMMALVLVVPAGARLVTTRRLPGVWWRAVLFLISPTYLLVIFWAVFSDGLSPWLILAGYLTSILSAFFLSVLSVTRKIGPGRRRTMLALGLMVALQAFAWTALDFLEVDRFGDWGAVAIRAYLVSELLMVAIPVIGFFIFFLDSPRKLGAFIRRPHLTALFGALVATAVGLGVVLYTDDGGSFMSQVAYLSMGITLSVPGGPAVYLISLFFGSLLVGCLLFSFGRWKTDGRSQRLGLGLAFVWIAGLQPYRVYQFALMLLGFVLITLSMAEVSLPGDKGRDSVEDLLY